MSGLCIAVDAGGTRTRVRVTRDDATVAEGEGRAGAVRAGTAFTASLTISELVRATLTRAGLGLTRADVLVVGAAGTGREPEREALELALRAERLATRLIVTTDAAIAMADAFGDGPGIMLSAGTGSIALARAADGVLHRVGGWGWQIGDEGSGAWIGREALRAVLRMRDGRDATTALREAVRVAARAADEDALVRWGNSASASELATLAPAVLTAAAQGDPAATRLQNAAIAALVELAVRAGAASGATMLVLSGGLLAHAAIRDGVTAGVSPLTTREAPADPLRGALRLAEA